jgi:hypothetical protein
MALADAKLYEQKTSNPANYALVGVEEVAAKTAKGVRIELEGLDKPLKLIVGKREPGAQSTFVRRANEPESWLVHVDIDAPAEPDKWLVKDIANVGADRVREADVSIDGQAPYSAVKNARTDPSFAVSPLPKGRELTSASAANGFATALMNLTLDDVRQKQAFDGKKSNAHATFKSFDGLVVELEGWVENNVHWFALKPSVDADLARKFFVPSAPPAAGESKDKADAKPATADTVIASTKKEADDLAAKTTNWVFQVPDYKYDAIFKPLDQLLKKPEEKKLEEKKPASKKSGG